MYRARGIRLLSHQRWRTILLRVASAAFRIVASGNTRTIAVTRAAMLCLAWKVGVLGRLSVDVLVTR